MPIRKSSRPTPTAKAAMSPRTIGRLIAGFLLSFPASFFVPASASAQPVRQFTTTNQYIDFLTTNTRSVASGFKRIYCPRLTGTPKQRCLTTQIEVQESPLIMAGATIQDGRDVIIITAGQAMVFDLFDEAWTLSDELTGSSRCFTDYVGAMVG